MPRSCRTITLGLALSFAVARDLTSELKGKMKAVPAGIWGSICWNRHFSAQTSKMHVAFESAGNACAFEDAIPHEMGQLGFARR